VIGSVLLRGRTAGVEGDYANLPKEELLHSNCALNGTAVFLESYTKASSTL